MNSHTSTNPFLQDHPTLPLSQQNESNVAELTPSPIPPRVILPPPPPRPLHSTNGTSLSEIPKDHFSEHSRKMKENTLFTFHSTQQDNLSNSPSSKSPRTYEETSHSRNISNTNPNNQSNIQSSNSETSEFNYQTQHSNQNSNTTSEVNNNTNTQTPTPTPTPSTRTTTTTTTTTTNLNTLLPQYDLIFPEASTETIELLQRLHSKLSSLNVNQWPPPIENDTNTLELGINPTMPSIHELISTADEETLQSALHKIIDPNIPNRQGLPPLVIAVVTKRVHVVSLLLSHSNINPNVTDRNGLTALHYVCSFGLNSSHPELLKNRHKFEEEELTNLRILEFLLHHPKININVVDNCGQTPLLLAVMSGNINCVALLLNKGAAVNVCSTLGTTPLHVAAERGHVKFVHLLLGAGAHVNVQDNFGQTPLHLAAKRNQKEIVKILKQHGANPNIIDMDGHNAISITASEEIRNILMGMKTSETHPLQVDFVTHTVLGNSKIGMTMCPGRNKGEWRRDLAADLNVLKGLHVDVLVSLVKQNELQSMGIAHLITNVQFCGIESIHFPIQDKWIPSNIGEVASLVEMIVLRVRQGKTIVVHCNGGKGRTGLVVAATLYVLGLPIDEGLKLIREARPGMIQNPVQLVYLKVFKMYWDNKHKQNETFPHS